MRAAISLLVLLLSMCGVQTESHGTDASTQLDVSTELKELRDLVVELRAMKQRLAASESKVEVLEADNVAMKQRLVVSETKVEALEDTKTDMKTEVDILKKQNAAQEAELTAVKKDSAAVKTRLAARETVIDNLKNETAAQTELTAVKTRLAATETEVENLEKEIKAAPKVAFSAGLDGGYTEAGRHNGLNLVFSRVLTNVGQSYSSTTGFFTAPVRGVYYFRFTVMDNLDRRSMAIAMNKNGKNLMYLWEYDTDGQASYLSSGLALQLEKGDVVNLWIPPDDRLYSWSSTFSGFLLFPL